MKPFWTTFYSYKGGVGRSMALSNIAALLVQKGRRVVLIDFDLEAPGLDSFQEFGQSKGKPGVVEYVSEFQKNNIAPDINRFVHECSLPGPLPGRLWVMPSGKKDSTYNRLRSELNWSDLYESGLGEPFIENWKAAIGSEFQPDYVLVDSRTGLTDVGGICTLHLPDLVVMLFGLNDQNIHGISAVGKAILEADHNRIPQIHYVASPVPNIPVDKSGPLKDRFDKAAEIIGTRIDSSISYNPVVALHEELYVLRDPAAKRQLTRDYKDLLGKIVEFNRNGLDFLADQVSDIVKSGETGRAEKLYSVLEREFQGRADALFLMSRLRLACGNRPDSISLAEQALRMEPTHQKSFQWLLVHYNYERQYKKTLEICDIVLADSHRIDDDRLVSIHLDRGSAAMAAQNFSAAVESFQFCVNEEIKKKNQTKDPNSGNLMVVKFNLAESKRRLGHISSALEWREIVSLYESSLQSAETQLPNQANRLQAIHLAYALSGDIARAQEVLIKSKQAAELLGDIEDIFTVKTYENVSQPEFIKITNEMLAALENGTLWDGFPIN